MLKEIKEILEKYAIYVTIIGAVMLLGVVGISIFAFIVIPYWNLRLLAVSALVIAIGGLINMWNFFRSSKEHNEHVRIEKEKLNKVDMQINLQKQRLDKQDTVIKKLEKANRLVEQAQKRQHQMAKDQLKSRLEPFVSCREDGKKIISEGGKQKRDELQKELSKIGNELRSVVTDIEKLLLLSQDNLNEAKNIADGIKDLSNKIIQRVTVANKGEDITQKKNKLIEEWNNLVERARKLIEDIQQEGEEEEKRGKEDE